jgi:DNA-binding phage protein
MSKPRRSIPAVKPTHLSFDYAALWKLMESAGGVSAACRAAGINRENLYRLRAATDLPVHPSITALAKVLGLNIISFRNLFHQNKSK